MGHCERQGWKLGIFIGSNLLCGEMMGVASKLMGQVEAHTDVIVLTGY